MCLTCASQNGEWRTILYASSLSTDFHRTKSTVGERSAKMVRLTSAAQVTRIQFLTRIGANLEAL
jgi:hypothetical protein